MAERPHMAVIDASVLVDLLVGTELADAAHQRLSGVELHAPGHVDVEVLSALGRLSRADLIPQESVTTAIAQLAAAPITRHPLPGLLAPAWSHHQSLRITDAFYVALAEHLGFPLVTSDRRLARAWSGAQVLE